MGQPSNAAFLDATPSNIPAPSIEQSTQATLSNIAGSPFNAPFSTPFPRPTHKTTGDDSPVVVKEEDNEATSHTKSLFEMVANGQPRASAMNSEFRNSPFSHLSLPSKDVSKSTKLSSSERYDSPFANLPVIPSVASSMTLIGDKQQSQVPSPDTSPANSFDSDRTFRVPSEQLEQERVAIQERASVTNFNSATALVKTGNNVERSGTTGSSASIAAKASEIVSSATSHDSASAFPSTSASATPPSALEQMLPTKNAATDDILGSLREKLNTKARVGIVAAREKAIAEVTATKASKSVSFELPPTDPSTPVVSFGAQPQAPTATANEQEATFPDNGKPSSTPANRNPVAAQRLPNSTVEKDQLPPQVHGSTAGLTLRPAVITPLNTAATTPRLAELLAELASIDTMRATKRSKYLDQKAEYQIQKENAEICKDRVWREGVEWTWRAKLRMHNESMLDLAADRERLEEQIEEEQRREAMARELGRQKELVGKQIEDTG